VKPVDYPHAAWMVQQWAIEKRPQKEIAESLGYSAGSAVCSAIAEFIVIWHPRGNGGVDGVYDGARMQAGREALARYQAAGGPIIPAPSLGAPAGHDFMSTYYDARMEHCLLLRCEGLLLREIAERLGVSRDRVRCLLHREGTKLSRAMRKVKFYVDTPTN
jgi:hypothetical protein